MIVRYRIQQGVRTLLAFAQSVDEPLARHYLNAAQWHIFCGLARSEQLHSLNVLRAVLRQSAETPRDLAIAALLHDVGKSRYHMSLPQKTSATLIKAFLPAVFDHLSAEEDLTTWRAPFAVYRYHPQWGAALLCRTGASERTLWLVAHHQENRERWRDHPHYPLLERLQRADDTN